MGKTRPSLLSSSRQSLFAISHLSSRSENPEVEESEPFLYQRRRKKMNNNMEKEKKKQKQKQKQKRQFEFCKVCKLNHDQGRGHIYFPNHKKSLSSFLSRFLSNLSELRSFLKNPSSLPPHRAIQNGLWCIFCDSDISELHSSFACENSIKHLAGAEHLNNVREFLRKYGGGMDRVDSFRVSESDLDKWEKSCKSLKSVASSSSEGSFVHLSGPSKDIHYKLNSVTTDRFEKTSNFSFKSSFSNSVMPLQCSTNESYQVSHPEVARVANSAAVSYDAVPLSMSTHRNMDIPGMSTIGSTAGHHTVCMESQHACFSNSKGSTATSFHNDSWVQQKDIGESNIQVFQSFTQIGRLPEEPIANVHSGAPPPWLEMGEESGINLGATKDLHMNDVASHSDQLHKSRKLNPKRVGAAWAEKRRIELEREKRGETAANNCDDSWLPNFGRVWQAGTRKESRKEFEMEKQRLLNVENTSEASIVVQPYKSKRARRDAGENDGTFH